jgi:enoyl-CoA hydratase/carnithine racemase
MRHMPADAFETITFEVRDHVAWITLNRPDVMNAFNMAMQMELRQAWLDVRMDDDIRVAVLTGAGEKAFCSGIDRGEFKSLTDADPEDQLRVIVETSTHFDPIGQNLAPKSGLQCWKPIIAAVNGIAAGGALYMLGEADIIICSENATFFDPHVSFAMVAAYESVLMAHRIPLGEVLRMQLMGTYERMSAERALQIGLVSEVVPLEGLLDAAGRIAEAVAAQSPSAVQGTLRATWAAHEYGRTQALQLGKHYLDMVDTRDFDAMQAEFMAGKRIETHIR